MKQFNVIPINKIPNIDKTDKNSRLIIIGSIWLVHWVDDFCKYQSYKNKIKTFFYLRFISIVLKIILIIYFDNNIKYE